jgi:glucan-binding YG repeat protein
MITGWKLIEGAWYYFNNDGALLTSAVAPDGHTVGADGKLIS